MLFDKQKGPGDLLGKNGSMNPVSLMNAVICCLLNAELRPPESSQLADPGSLEGVTCGEETASAHITTW